jgi:hypothetical protein
MAELQRGAENGQLDPELVETFIKLLRREGPTFAQDADFETELDFERRVRTMAEPRSAEAAPRASRPRHGGDDWRTRVSRLRQRALNKG